jgi:hypothetical protein
MTPPVASRRSSELQKRLERRNISLRPSDFCSSGKRNHLLPSNNNNNNVHNCHIPEIHSTDPSTSSKEEGIQPIQEIDQESQENNSKLANTWEGQQQQQRQLEKPNSKEVTSLKRILQTHPATSKMNGSYLPIATSAGRGVTHQVEDAEQEYNRMFVAPSLIEVPRKGFSDDAVTDVSEITTDIRSSSLRGASYTERRMAAKLQRMVERNHGVTVQPSGFHQLSDHADDEVVELQNNSGSYVQGEICDLKHLIQKVEQVKKGLQKAGPAGHVVRRYGLPYEATDYRAEGDDDYSIDPWDGAIGDVQQPCSPSPRRDAIDPEDGQVICVQGPPTPRDRPCPEKRIHNLIRETISSEGDVVIDATAVRDEDLDDLKKCIKVSDSKTAATSVLLGELIIDTEETTTIVTDADVPPSTQQDFAEGVLTRGQDVLMSVTGDKSTTAARGTISLPPYYDYGESRFSSIRAEEDDSSILVQADIRKKEDFSSRIVNSSLAFIKSFAAEIDTQLKYIKSRGLISENDMDGLLGVLERDMDETAKRIPRDSGDFVIDFGEELERTTCGAKDALIMPSSASSKMIPKPSKDLMMMQSNHVTSMLDSLKASYESGLSQCGVDHTLIKDNTKAMEDLVAKLKDAYQNSTSVCGGTAQQDILTATAAAGVTTTAVAMDNKPASSVAAEQDAVSLMDEPSVAVDSPYLRYLVNQLQVQKQGLPQQQQQQQRKSIHNSDNPPVLSSRDSIQGDASTTTVGEMLKRAKEACFQKSTKLGKLKNLQRKYNHHLTTTTKTASAATTATTSVRNYNKKQPLPEPQTFIVPINMPRETNTTTINNITGSVSVSTAGQGNVTIGKGYSEIE